jgi:hypothetical protein
MSSVIDTLEENREDRGHAAQRGVKIPTLGLYGDISYLARGGLLVKD